MYPELVPPLLIVLTKPGIFIAALSSAGLIVLILLLILPALMTWRGRYHLSIAKGYRVYGGRVLPIALLIFATFVICQMFIK